MVLNYRKPGLVILCIIAAGLFCNVSVYDDLYGPLPVVNFLVNPGFETGDTTGWQLNNFFGDTNWIGWHGGDGSGVHRQWGMADSDLSYGPPARTGRYSLVASYEWCWKTQTVDITAYGLTPGMLAGTGTAIRYSEYFRNIGGTTGSYYLKLTLRDSSSALIASIENGNQTAFLIVSSYPDWTRQELTFTNTAGYGDIRYIEVESGGDDVLGWDGNYGPQFDDASLTIEL